MSLFDPSRNVSPQASGRIQRWSLKLAMYQYTLKFRPTAQHANADALSRLPLPDKPDNVPLPGELVLLIDHLPTRPWSRIHIDFAGPMDNLTFFVIIDAHSKWIEVFKMNSTTATATIQVLRTVFARFGIPESIVSDNGPQFTSSEFTEFCHVNGIHHVRVPPYHPSSPNVLFRHSRKVSRKCQKAQFKTKFLIFCFPTV